jgi:hypothetical protein
MDLQKKSLKYSDVEQFILHDFPSLPAADRNKLCGIFKEIYFTEAKKDKGKLQPMMVRPVKAVREYLEFEVEDGNAINMVDALNRAVGEAMSKREESQRELLSAFGGRNGLLIGLLAARLVAAFEARGIEIMESASAFKSFRKGLGEVLEMIAPTFSDALGQDDARHTDMIAEEFKGQFARNAVGFPLAWQHVPSASLSALLPVDEIVATWKRWVKRLTR